MSSAVDICNLALLRIGAAAIASLDESSNEAGFCNRLWVPMRQAVLRDHTWNFSLKTASLAQLSETPADFTYAYQLPSDCLRVVDIIGSESDYEIRARKLYTDDETITLKYVADISNTETFDSLFADALSYRLAAELCLPVTGQVQKASLLNNFYQAALQRARAMDSREGRKDESRFRVFCDARA